MFNFLGDFGVFFFLCMCCFICWGVFNGDCNFMLFVMIFIVFCWIVLLFLNYFLWE